MCVYEGEYVCEGCLCRVSVCRGVCVRGEGVCV